MRKLGLGLFAFLSLGASVALAQSPPRKPGSVAPESPPPKPTEPAPPEPAPAPAPAPEPAPVATVVGGGAYSKANWPGAAVTRPVQLAASMIEIRANVIMSLSKSAVMKPFSIAPDVFYGINDKMQVGLTHSGFGSAASSLCLAGTKNGCAKVYHNVGIDFLYGLASGANDFSAHVSYNFFSLDPNIMKLGLGLTGKMHLAPNMALWFDPQIYVGLNSRDGGGTVTAPKPANKEIIYVPVAFQYQVNPQLMAGLHTGITGPTSKFGDSFQIPVGLMGLFNINPMLDAGLRFTFDNLAGKHVAVPPSTTKAGAADARTLALLLNVRL